jgi:Undecaprenyl-phosphate glucose phosphotransferase
MSVSAVVGLSEAGPAALSAQSGADRPSAGRWSRRVAIDVLGLADALVIPGSAWLLLAVLPIGETAPNWSTVIQAGLIASIVLNCFLRSRGFYDSAAIHALPIKPLELVWGILLAFAAALGLAHPVLPGSLQAGAWYAAWVATSSTLLLAGRFLAHRILERATAAGRFDDRIAVFGAGAIARRVHDHLAWPGRGIRLVGVYDDRVCNGRIHTDGLPVAGSLEDLVGASREGLIDQIVIALPAAADGRIAEIVRKLEPLPVSIHVVTHIASDLVEAGAAHNVSAIGSVGLLDLKDKALADWAPLVKRVEDLVIGTLAVLLALPLFIAIAIAIKLDSPGPVFFIQRRRGLNRRTIEVLKFRTMTVLEDGDDLRQASRNDPRVTGVGRILRCTSLDELPQLINVLKGEMSLVGPRPHALVHDEQWGERLERYANRQQVKPGITGLAQVKGLRGEIHSSESIGERVAHDLAYIANWSLWLDLKLVALTLKAVLEGKNAH